MRWFVVIILTFVLNSMAIANNVFIDNRDGTVTDKEAGLMWQSDLAWFPNFGCGNPEAYCKNLDLGTYSDWKLPEINLLNDLYSKKQYFPGGIRGSYWADKYHSSYTQYFFNFDSGTDGATYCKNGATNKVRCVRVVGINNNTNIPVSIISEWIKFGFTLDEMSEWLDKYNTRRCSLYNISPDTASLWKSNGFSASETCEWNIHTENDLAKSWGPQVAKSWKDLSFNMEDAWLWHFSFSPNDAVQWKALPLNLEDAKDWSSRGFSPKEAKEWLTNNFSISNAVDWHNEGFNPSEAMIWRESFAKSSDAKKWKQYGFTVKDAENWNKFKFDPQNALEWKTDGKTVEEASKWVGYNPQVAKRLQILCKNGVGTYAEAVMKNPFDTKDQCYRVVGDMFQLLDRNQALYKFYDKIFLVDFNNESAAVNLFEGWVMGKGAYKYIDTVGSQRIIPYFEKISF